MGNINAPEIEYFKSYSDEIKSKFQRIKSLTSHTGSSGDYHEEILRTVIRNFLTKRYSVKKGFIYKGQENISKQIDILIIDESLPAAYIFQEGDFAIVLPEAVVATIEVKTTLKKPDFIKAIDNIKSVNELYADPLRPMPYPFTLIFGYSGTTITDKLLDSWFKSKPDLKGREFLSPSAIFFFNDEYLLTRHTEQGAWSYFGKYYHNTKKTTQHGDVGWQLSIILAMIVSKCEAKESYKTHHFPENLAEQLIQGEGSVIAQTKYAFGEGVSKIIEA